MSFFNKCINCPLNKGLFYFGGSAPLGGCGQSICQRPDPPTITTNHIEPIKTDLQRFNEGERVRLKDLLYQEGFNRMGLVGTFELSLQLGWTSMEGCPVCDKNKNGQSLVPYIRKTSL